MEKTNTAVSKLFSIRNQYGKEAALQKIQLLRNISMADIKSKKAAQTLYVSLLFLQAYPDNKSVYAQAGALLPCLKEHISGNKTLQNKLYNSGITGTTLCAAFGFEMLKWLRKTHAAETRLDSFEKDDAAIMSLISVVMPKAESEIFQDGNATWRSWLKRLKKPGEDMLDQLIAVFNSSDIRAGVKDELWNAIGVNTEIDITSHCCLPQSLTKIFYHRSLIRKKTTKEPALKAVRVKLTKTAAEQIIDCSRMILVQHLREIDPISFTAADLVLYYQLPRGLSIALMEMIPERRHPIDSYMGYKNGLPVAYAGSWILFDSGRIGLNVFPGYRGGETGYIFEQVLRLHAKVYNLNRFSVDPYQIGKDNSDGIQSGAFWVYYRAGFLPVEKKQMELAATEAAKIKAEKKYRSPARTLKILAESRLELIINKRAVRFDATDMSRVFAGIISKKCKGDRLLTVKDGAKKLAGILQLISCRDDTMYFILKNWAPFILCKQNELVKNSRVKKSLKTLFTLKATGSELEYIAALQQAFDLRQLLEELIKIYAVDPGR
jgi:hypothetical protein